MHTTFYFIIKSSRVYTLRITKDRYMNQLFKIQKYKKKIYSCRRDSRNMPPAAKVAQIMCYHLQVVTPSSHVLVQLLRLGT
jgi:hypothetical protein